MPEQLTLAEREAKETNLRRIIADAEKDLASLTGTAPPPKNGGKDNLATRANAEDTDAALFDRLLASGEIVRLREEDPARYEQLKEARRVAGERALFQRYL